MPPPPLPSVPPAAPSATSTSSEEAEEGCGRETAVLSSSLTADAGLTSSLPPKMTLLGVPGAVEAADSGLAPVVVTTTVEVEAKASW